MYTISQLVFADEVGVTRGRMEHRRRGRLAMGTRAIDRGVHILGKHYSALALMNLTGVLTHYTGEGGLNTEKLCYFALIGMLDVLNPFPQPNSVLILDNCRIHKSDEFLKILQDHGVIVLFLPPYSPWLNPIEQVFRAVKAWLRRHARAMLAEGHTIHIHLSPWHLRKFQQVHCQSLISEAGYIGVHV